MNRLLLCALVLLPLVGRAAGMELSSDTLSVTPGTRTALAQGSVVARSDTFEVTCDEAEAHYVSDGGKRVVDRLVLRGQVHVVRSTDGLDARSSQATWSRTDGRLEMTGDPIVKRGVDELRGESIVLGTNDDRVFVKSPDVTLASGRDTPVHIRAKRLEIPPGAHRARFEEQVVIREGDLVTRAARADALLAGTDEDRRLTRLVLTGRVEARRDGRTAKAEKATWDATTRDLVLEGRPVVEQDGESIAGERITLEGATGKARVETAVVKLKRNP